MSFAEIGVELGFRGENENEEAYVVSNQGKFDLNPGRVVVKVDTKYFRPTEVDLLIGDASKAEKLLGWQPKYTLSELVTEMITNDLSLINNKALIIK